jgi:hypothetical protein
MRADYFERYFPQNIINIRKLRSKKFHNFVPWGYIHDTQFSFVI